MIFGKDRQNSCPVQPHPEEPVCAEQPRATWSLPPQDSYLMSQGDELKLQ